MSEYEAKAHQSSLAENIPYFDKGWNFQKQKLYTVSTLFCVAFHAK